MSCILTTGVGHLCSKIRSVTGCRHVRDSCHTTVWAAAMSYLSPKRGRGSSTQRIRSPSRAIEEAGLCTTAGKDVAFKRAEQRGLSEPESRVDGEANMVTKDHRVSSPTDDVSTCAKTDDSLRGARATNTAVKDFWIACRGAEFAYTT